jgi:signal peptidase II
VLLLAVVGAVVVVGDLVTKLAAVEYLSGREPIELIPGALDLRLTRNSGAAFSLAGGATVMLSLLAIAVVAVMVRVARRLRSVSWAFALGLLGGGAVGNLIDRVFRSPGPLRGHVVDWIHLERWPVFNIADSAITIGAVVALVLSVWGIGMDGRRDRGRTVTVVPEPATAGGAGGAGSSSTAVAPPPDSAVDAPVADGDGTR